MVIDNNILAGRLRRARLDRGLTQAQAAEELRIPRTAVAQMEAGKRAASSLELVHAARLYGRPLDWFVAEGDVDLDDPVRLLLRADPGFESAPEFSASIRTLVDLCREGVRLQRIVGRTDAAPLPGYRVGAPRGHSDAIEVGTRIAGDERRRLSLGQAPIMEIHQVIAEQGIWTSIADLPPGVSGLCVHHPSVGVAMIVDRHQPVPRRRFSFAHEYAHALLDRRAPVTVTSVRNESSNVETRANVFAAAFLMPEDGVRAHLSAAGLGLRSREQHEVLGAASGNATRQELRSGPQRAIESRDVLFLAIHFGVSYEAAAYRLKSLRYLDARECQSLLTRREQSSKWMRAFAGDQVDPDSEGPGELAQQVVRLALEAYDLEDGISRSKLIELSRQLRFDVDSILELAESGRSST